MAPWMGTEKERACTITVLGIARWCVVEEGGEGEPWCCWAGGCVGEGWLACLAGVGEVTGGFELSGGVVGLVESR